MTLADRFLKAKHWQLFLLTFVPPLIFQVYMMGAMFGSFTSHTGPDPSFMINYFKIFPPVIIVVNAVFFGWFWAMVTGLQKKIRQTIRINTKWFKILLFIPLAYMLLIAVGMGTLMSAFMESVASGDPPNLGLILGIMAIVFPLHLFSIFCIFHSIYFVAKTFKTVELQREVSFSDFVGEFFLVWFYPIGIWFIQPKVNKMVEDDITS